MDCKNIDVATATASLNHIRDELRKAVDDLTEAAAHQRDLIVSIRPSGILTVDKMAEALGQRRNYVDSVWSVHGTTVKGKQTRVPAPVDGDAKSAFNALAVAASNRMSASNRVNTIRAERDRIVTMIYTSEILGPTGIAAAVGVDRNHVLRIARKAGAPPAHRTNSRNQYSI